MPNICRRVPLLVVVVVVATVVSAGADGGVAFDLESVFGTERFSSTLPSELLWLPDGSAFLLRQQRDGVDGVWRHDVASGAETLIVDWTALERRLEEARPAWVAPAMDDVNTHPTVGLGPVMSPDGSALVGVAEGDLFELDLSDGSAHFLTDHRGAERFATFSPDGGRLAFVRDGDLFVLDFGGGAETRLTDREGRDTLLNGRADWVYEEELDVKRAFWWSPDGRALAFLQFDTAAIPPVPIVDGMTVVPTLERQRYPKAGGANSTVRLGVVPAAGGEARWLDVAVGGGYLARAGWLPGGSAVWVQVLDRSQKRLELKVVDVSTSDVRTVLAETDPAWVNVGDELTFLDDETFVWASERDGYRHLYLVGADGTVRRQLTSGTWQVTEVYGVDRKRRRVLFQGNRGDPRERHLFAVGLDGGDPIRLDDTPGTHDAVFAPGFDLVLDTASTLTTPPRLDLRDGDGGLVRTVDDGRIPALEDVPLAEPELGTLTADDGETLYTYTLKPPDFDPSRRYPTLLYVYGGPGVQIVTNDWWARRGLFFQLLARRGLVIFALDNRGSFGRGHAFEAAVAGRLGTVEMADQLAGVRYLESRPWVDSSRVGVYGGSYGGFMTLTLMTRAGEHFASGIAYAPVTDWRLYDSVYTERYMGTPAANPDGYRTSAPVTHAAELRGDLLICHGAMDNNVHTQNTLQFAGAAMAAGHDLQLMIFPRVRHGIRVSRMKLPFHRLKADFVQRHLIEREASPEGGSGDVEPGRSRTSEPGAGGGGHS